MNMDTQDLSLNLVVDLYGCPNRCLHCWLGHMPNRAMEKDADQFIVDSFYPYFDRIAFYSWVREPDFCADYAARWERDKAISKNALPERFELASFWRIVRDGDYIPFLRSVGVKKVQLSFFGLAETQDRYVGRKGAFEEVCRASDLLIEGGIVPRWQGFINEENRDELVEVLHLAQDVQREKCPELEFFVHEGSCDGENRRLYPIRIQKSHIPEALLPYYLDYDKIMTEKECCAALKSDGGHPSFPIGKNITLNISNTYDVYYNFTHMTRPWVIGNLKTDDPDVLVRRILTGDTFALHKAQTCTWAALSEAYGDPDSEKVFRLDDFKTWLFNAYLEDEEKC